MATVRDLLDTLTDNNGERAVLVEDSKGNFVQLQHSFCVEDETLFLFTEGDCKPLTANQLQWYIENEAEDECWFNGYRESLFLDCEVVIGSGNPDDSECEYIETYHCYAGADNALIISCNMNDGPEIRNVAINLSSEEVEMIKQALEYFGEKVKSVEPSSGEAYFKLLKVLDTTVCDG